MSNKDSIIKINTRNQFGELAQCYNQLGIGAEIGVLHGEFTKLTFAHWRGKILCIDTWDTSCGTELVDRNLLGENYECMRGYSLDMAKLVGDGNLDWIYIDANHDYNSIKSDYNAWFPKVREGGIVSGHDYGVNKFGVKKFVDELDIPLYLTTDDIYNGEPYQTWYFIK
jgi:hypothetical protein